MAENLKQFVVGWIPTNVNQDLGVMLESSNPVQSTRLS
jgi:hypothetical protein